MMGITPADVEGLLVELASMHGVVLHPHTCIPWIVHPFSLTPTIHWITAGSGSWWAPCVWCAFGVAALVGDRVRIYTRYGAESEPLILDVVDGRPLRNDIVVEIGILAARKGTRTFLKPLERGRYAPFVRRRCK